VSLTVDDMLGRQVFVLLNDRRDAGVYEVKFDARLPAGQAGRVRTLRVECTSTDCRQETSFKQRG
jgi:hypothetical protein